MKPIKYRMPKRPVAKTDFQKTVNKEQQIADARARGKAEMAHAAQIIQRDKQFRSKHGLVQDNAARDREREKIRTHAVLDESMQQCWPINQH